MVTRGFPGGPVAKALSSHAGSPGSIPGQGAGSHMLQLKILYAATKAQCHRRNIFRKRAIDRREFRQNNADAPFPLGQTEGELKAPSGGRLSSHIPSADEGKK